MCEVCGTIERYGKRVSTGRRLCIDCWKLKKSKRDDKTSKISTFDEEESD
jgi:hypothetical protein